MRGRHTGAREGGYGTRAGCSFRLIPLSGTPRPTSVGENPAHHGCGWIMPGSPSRSRVPGPREPVCCVAVRVRRRGARAPSRCACVVAVCVLRHKVACCVTVRRDASRCVVAVCVLSHRVACCVMVQRDASWCTCCVTMRRHGVRVASRCGVLRHGAACCVAVRVRCRGVRVASQCMCFIAVRHAASRYVVTVHVLRHGARVASRGAVLRRGARASPCAVGLRRPDDRFDCSPRVVVRCACCVRV